MSQLHTVRDEISLLAVHRLSLHYNRPVRDVGGANADAQHFRSVLVEEPTRLTIVRTLVDLDRVAAGRLGFDEVLKRH